MPTIQRLHSNNGASNRKKERQKAYQSKQWVNLRDWFRKCNPLCADCQDPNIVNEDGTYRSIVSPMRDIHHIKSPFDSGLSEEEKQTRLLDENNLVALCRFHHNLRHNQATPKDPNTPTVPDSFWFE